MTSLASVYKGLYVAACRSLAIQLAYSCGFFCICSACGCGYAIQLKDLFVCLLQDPELVEGFKSQVGGLSEEQKLLHNALEQLLRDLSESKQHIEVRPGARLVL